MPLARANASIRICLSTTLSLSRKPGSETPLPLAAPCDPARFMGKLTGRMTGPVPQPTANNPPCGREAQATRAPPRCAVGGRARPCGWRRRSGSRQGWGRPPGWGLPCSRWLRVRRCSRSGACGDSRPAPRRSTISMFGKRSARSAGNVPGNPPAPRATRTLRALGRFAKSARSRCIQSVLPGARSSASGVATTIS